MCLFRKCDETVIETKEYPSLLQRMEESSIEIECLDALTPDDLMMTRLTTIKCNACGRVRIDQRSV